MSNFEKELATMVEEQTAENEAYFDALIDRGSVLFYVNEATAVQVMTYQSPAQ